MATIFRNLFRSKKSSSKHQNDENNEDLARNIDNRRSFRAGTSSAKSARRMMTTRFADDAMLSATAAYHTNNAPKLRKGPQSCPGGYRDESECSFDSDKYSTKSGRSRQILNQSTRQNYTIDEGSQNNKSSRNKKRYNDFRRGDTSEYGSGDPSPIGRHSHYEGRLDESEENDDFDDKDQIVMMERTNRHYMQKWKESEQKRREEKKKYKELERERNDMQNAMFSYMRQADQLKKEKDKYKAKVRQMENQLNELRQQQFHQMNFNTPFGSFHQQSQQNQRGFMMLHPPTSNTPTTMNSGAGESLVNPGDMSLLQFHQHSIPHTNNILGGNGSPLMPFGGKTFMEEDGEDEDEVKNFRAPAGQELCIETARGSTGRQEELNSPISSADSNITLKNDNKENNRFVKMRPIENSSKSSSTNNRSFSIMSI
ncbi:unnamed protein product [Caenorhabditis angaria]|uniref:Uncharacterized protein n=1 Tax=Caenorhabditis angaria TaxID=860376 RepID=A0A9P1MV60_9PELO|nr:unnamed protein product [Caenorhabditis angaria]